MDDEDSVINYKLCTWSSLKIEGWSTTGENRNSHNQLRLIVGATSIRISFKRKVSDSSLMGFRISMHLGQCYLSDVCMCGCMYVWMYVCVDVYHVYRCSIVFQYN